VVVIDLDSEQDTHTATARWQRSNRVLIGSATPSALAAEERFLAKPFHFPELVQVIEELLATRPAA
jgi:hypothetical protein